MIKNENGPCTSFLLREDYVDGTFNVNVKDTFIVDGLLLDP